MGWTVTSSNRLMVAGAGLKDKQRSNQQTARSETGGMPGDDHVIEEENARIGMKQEAWYSVGPSHPQTASVASVALNSQQKWRCP